MKFNNKILYTMCFLISTAFLQSTAIAKTTSATTVHVRNMTGKEIESVSVVHKYSNVFKEKKDWGRLLNGRKTTEAMKIRHNTGFGTTGQDWWLVTWKYKGDNKVRFTAPNNFRDIIDSVERLILSSFEADGELKDSPTAKIAGLLFNTGSTVGFKKHLLRKEDDPKGVLITIKRNSVEFKSKSGKSTTEGISTKRVKSAALTQPKQCEQLVQNKVNWGRGTRWNQQSLRNLCQKSKDARKTVNCFRAVIAVHKGNWQHATNACKAK